MHIEISVNNLIIKQIIANANPIATAIESTKMAEKIIVTLL